MWLFLAFLAVPLIEIALFIQVGGAIGLWPTLLIVIVTAIVGTFLVRTQGAMALNQLRGSLSSLQDPTAPLAHGAMILFAGALLLTPGFFTDACGFALLMPPVRDAVIRFGKSRINVQTFEMGGQQGQHPHHPHRPHAGTDAGKDVIDGDFTEVEDPPKRPTHRPSGWTKH